MKRGTIVTIDSLPLCTTAESSQGRPMGSTVCALLVAGIKTLKSFLREELAEKKGKKNNMEIPFPI